MNTMMKLLLIQITTDLTIENFPKTIQYMIDLLCRHDIFTEKDGRNLLTTYEVCCHSITEF